MSTLDADGHVPGDDSAAAAPAGQPAAAPAEPTAAARHTRLKRLRHWRRTRPFWGGLIMILGGAEILLTVWAPLPVVLHMGLQNSLGYLIPIVIVLGGLLVVFHPAQRTFAAVVTAVLGLAAWLTSNLGGFVVGMLLTLIGSAMAFAWRPRPLAPRSVPAAPDRADA